MSETRPHLEVVNEKSVEAGANGPRPAEPGRDPWKLWVVGGALVLALAICAGGWWTKAQESTRLTASLATSEAALAATRSDLARAEGRLAAFEDHLTAVRDRVGALAGRIAALGDFLADGPGAEEPVSQP